jgi:cytochrome c-type biogenesis protein CcmI
LEPFAILIGLFILAGIAFYVSRPLLQASRQTKAGADASSLEAQRESLYTQIKELDMDHATGKINDEDYAPLRAELVAQAAAVLKQIDGVATIGTGSSAPATSPAAAQGDEVEAMIAARRKTRSVPAAKTADADVEAAIAARRKTAPPVASVSSADAPTAGAPTCPKCGKPINADDAFCAKCGTALQPQAVR